MHTRALLGSLIALALTASAPAAALAAGTDEKPYVNPRAFAWVRGILDRVAPAAGLDAAKVKLTLLDTREVNAYADVNGDVFVTRGLMQTVEWDDELAAVIGHEIAHVQRKHVMKNMAGKAVGKLAVDVLGSWTESETATQVGSALQNLALLKFSRVQESEADDYGMRYAAKAGFSPRGMVGVMKKLGAQAGSGGKLAKYLSSHPEPRSRVAHNEKSLVRFPAQLVHKPMTLTFGELRRVVAPVVEGGAPAVARTDSAPVAETGTAAAAPATPSAGLTATGGAARKGRTSARAAARTSARTDEDRPAPAAKESAPARRTSRWQELLEDTVSAVREGVEE